MKTEPAQDDTRSAAYTARQEPALQGAGIRGMVSVVIPTFNRAYSIGGCIDSVLRQTHTNVEIIVVDDGSTDDTQSVVERYGAPVRYVHQANAGVSAARNRGFASARGEFIALLDSDDQFLPWKLEAQVAVLERHPELGMAWTDMTAVDDHGEVIAQRFLRKYYDAHDIARIEDVLENAGPLAKSWSGAPPEHATAPVLKGELFSQMLLGNLVHTSTVVLRRDRLRQVGNFDTSLERSGEDYEFHLRTCSFGPVALIDTPSLLYRYGAADQLTAPHLAAYRARNNLTTVLRWLERGRGRVRLPRRVLRARIAEAYRWAGETELEYGDRAIARKRLLTSLTHEPFHFHTVVMLAFAILPRGVLPAARAVKRAIRSR